MNLSVTTDRGVICRAARAVPPSLMSGVLFGGDRLMCIDFAATAYVGGKLVGLATMASQGEMQGEMGVGKPALVGLWVHPDHRRLGIATSLVDKVLEYARKERLLPLRVDPITPSGEKFFSQPQYKSAAWDVRFMSMTFPLVETVMEPAE